MTVTDWVASEPFGLILRKLDVPTRARAVAATARQASRRSVHEARRRSARLVTGEPLRQQR